MMLGTMPEERGEPCIQGRRSCRHKARQWQEQTATEGSSEEGEDDDEDLEYNHDDDLDENSKIVKRKLDPLEV